MGVFDQLLSSRKEPSNQNHYVEKQVNSDLPDQRKCVLYNSKAFQKKNIKTPICDASMFQQFLKCHLWWEVVGLDAHLCMQAA